MFARAEMTTNNWLDAVQRDPRGMGQFQKRIEALLRDPAVARRVRARIRAEQEDAADRAASAAVRGRLRVVSPCGAEDRPRAAACACPVGSHALFSRCDGGAECCMNLSLTRVGRAAAPVLTLF